MRLTELIEQIEPNRYRCGVCQWRCELAAGELGRCRVRVGAPEGIEVLNDGMISAANFGPVEDFRMWHFFPGTQVLARHFSSAAASCEISPGSGKRCSRTCNARVLHGTSGGRSSSSLSAYCGRKPRSMDSSCSVVMQSPKVTVSSSIEA